MSKPFYPSEIAADVEWTGFNTLTVFGDGSWISPSGGRRVDDCRIEAGRFIWGQDECGDMCYTNVSTLVRAHFRGDA